MWKFLAVLAALCLLSGPAFAAEEGVKPPPAAAEKVLAEVPLDQEMLDDRAVADWVKGAAADIMTFDHKNHAEHFDAAKKYFTSVGWETFDAALKRSRVVDAVTSQSQTVTAEASGEPVIVQEGALGGKYRWIVQMPLVVTYKAPENKRVDKLQLNLVLERVSLAGSPDGIGIAQWIAQ
ncbi:MAG: hypothetical protein EPN97_10655 [Alphaproteobacteria bacterium]|nr:MAG: hypothetical protein EPN97_10655 [Alphaproteobacteria bacterium]